MIRNLKILGLALVAVLAMSVAASSSASAAGLFTAGVPAGETFKVDGEQIGTGDTFTLTNGLVLKCTTATLNGNAITAGPQSTFVTVHPSYSGCTVKVAGVTKLVTVTVNECNFIFNAATATTATAEVECKNAGEKIEIHVYNSATVETETLCTYDIEPQALNTGGEIKLENKTNTPNAVNDVVAKPIKLLVTLSSTIAKSVCSPEAKEMTDAEYTGEETLRATNQAGTLVDSSVS